MSDEEAETAVESLADYVDRLGLPETFTDRDAEASTAVNELAEKLRREAGDAKYVVGLGFGFVAVAEEILRVTEQDPFPDALEEHPPLEKDGRGRDVKTLTVMIGEDKVGLRKFYNNAEKAIRQDLRRYDYPNCAPHATGEWRTYREYLDALLAMSPGERRAFADELWEQVLALPRAERRSTAGTRRRPFATLLQEFDTKGHGEPGGAVLQGMAFAYFSADAPNVQLETHKVGAGGSRLGAVGDVDGWTGGELDLSVEVKDLDITMDNLDALTGFLVNLAEWPDTAALVVARSFSDMAKEALAEQAIQTLSKEDLIDRVELWDVKKQEAAVNGFEYFAVRVQQNTDLITRFDAFVQEQEIGD